MLENLEHSVGIVSPMILMMALGWFLYRVGAVNDEFIRRGSRFAFSVAFPCSIFTNFTGLELSALFNGRLLGYMLLAITLSVAVLLLIVPRLVKDRPRAASLTQAIFRANFLIQGVPLLESSYGAGNIARGAFLLPFLILANNVLATVIFVSLIPGQRKGGGAVLGALKKLAVNPLVIGSMVGLGFAALGWRLPAPLESAVTQLGHVGTPLALVCMGAELRFGNLRRDLRVTLPAVLARLVLIPGLTTLGGIALGFRGIELNSIFLFTATCSATSGYVMATALGGDSDIAAQCVCLSAILSAFTMTAGLFLLLQGRLI